jgi:hypothetical protein
MLTLLAFAALAGAFLLQGHRPLRFAASSGAALLGWIAAAHVLGSPGPSPLLGAAFGLWSAGLALTATMLHRSASLRALGRLAAGEDAIPAMQEDMARRIDELVGLGWAQQRDDRLEATPRGRRIGAATARVRRLFGADA